MKQEDKKKSEPESSKHSPNLICSYMDQILSLLVSIDLFCGLFYDGI
jgi:hypothetical protein